MHFTTRNTTLKTNSTKEYSLISMYCVIHQLFIAKLAAISKEWSTSPLYTYDGDKVHVWRHRLPPLMNMTTTTMTRCQADRMVVNMGIYDVVDKRCDTIDHYEANHPFATFAYFDAVDLSVKAYSNYRYGFNGMEKDDEVKGSGNSYDFGARMYDSRLGRFLSVDRLANDIPYQSTYLVSGNSPICAIDYNGDFKIVITDEAKEKYNLTEQNITTFIDIVRNMETYFTNNPEVVDYLVKQTGLTKEQILKDAKYGEGPTITINVQSVASPMAQCTIDHYKAGGFVIDGAVIQQLENTKETVPLYYALVLAVAQTITHEYTHFGDIKTNGFISGSWETPKIEGSDGNLKFVKEAEQDIKGNANMPLERGTSVDNKLFGTSTPIGHGSKPISDEHLIELKLKSEKKGWTDKKVKDTFLKK